MPDREKVIKGLECCTTMPDIYPHCEECPYAGAEGTCANMNGLHRDALALLKAQEPRLVTEADFDGADECGYLPVWVEDKDDSEIICDCITKRAITAPDEDYHYRYWTSRPTEEQREATPWM